MPHTEIFLEAHNIKNLYTGFGQFNYWLIKNLVALNTNYEFVINAKRKTSIKEFEEKVKFNRYYSFTRYPVMRTRKKYDLWHSLNQNSKIEPYHDVPYLLTMHDVIFLEKDPIEQVDKKKIALLKEKINRADSIVYISEHAKKSSNQYLDISKSTPQRVIYNGNPVSPIPPVEIPKTDFALNKPFLFCIGQFLEMKNFHSLVGMIYLLKDYNLIIAGNNDKPYAEVVKAEIEKYHLKDRVYLAGKISDIEKHFYLQNCKAFVFPSLFEGFGMPPIEAMAYGKQVFLANRTSLPEIGGNYAFYWDQFDPEYMSNIFIKGMETYHNETSVYQKELIKRASGFNWENTARNYLKIYSQILSK